MKTAYAINLLLWSSMLFSCESSPLGPDIIVRDETEEQPATDGSPTPGDQPTDDGGSTDGVADSDDIDQGGDEGGDDGDENIADGTTESCTRTSGHSYYYDESTIAITYTCTRAIGVLDTTAMPAFLSSDISGETVTFSGTAPEVASSTAWSFSINENPTQGDASSITTAVYLTDDIDFSLGAIDAVNNNDQVLPLDYTATLDANWDGAPAEVAFTADSISTDMHGVSLYPACASAVIPYVCNGTLANSGLTFDSDLDLRWQWSIFDQGTYFLSVSPRLVIEDGTNTPEESVTQTFTIPAQTADEVLITHSDAVNSATYNNTKYRYATAVNTASSTATNPVIGMTYVAADGAVHSTYFRRIAIDRSAAPGTVGNGVVEDADEVALSAGANSSDFSLRSLSDGTWLALGIVDNSNGGKDIHFAKIPDPPTASTPAAEDDLTDHLGTYDAVSADLTRPFIDGDDTERVGFAFVRFNKGTSESDLIVGKADTTGSTKAALLDTVEYSSETPTWIIDGGAANVDIDRVKIRYTTEEDVGYFYIAYRHDDTVEGDVDIKLSKVLADSATTPVPTTVVLADGVFTDASTSNFQILDLALGKSDDQTVAAIVYRNNSDQKCYFKRIDEDIAGATASTALAISENGCFFPEVHYVAATGRFVVNFCEVNAGATYDVKTTEVTLGSGATDSKTASLTIYETGDFDQTIKLTTDLYAEGHWMALFYRRLGTNDLNFHGYHVPGR